MNKDRLDMIEYQIALLVRLTTALSPRFGNLDRSEYLLLSELEHAGPLAINALAEHLLLNLSTASRQIAVLESKDYVKRYPDTNNGRISLIEITPGGLDILHKVQKARHDAYADMLKEWDGDELQHLEDSLTRLNRDLKKRHK
ncbi:DNA-binding MarR family transcriptional regulator [Paenibacillus rhizosphaerae]|uniref:DNA-binding MarR family transcriptional regulator n=1 Tax=Paenibacillus rhizosphaerae TaxID=297318 RepID=A0A839U1G5_9BACL|nr:MarR family transcriptional regulator [Paenibacillus rhizosphaerae]MBB3131498.1 DNA-binding MarR family transcriptional regulator [Paenibacillus rhizosphaerae]